MKHDVVEALNAGLNNLQQALEEHLTAINENTTEIQALFDYLHELEIKHEKLAQRLDRLQLSHTKVLRKQALLPLNHTEKKIFMALYTDDTPLSFIELAERSGVPLALLPECISALSNKGIPFVRSFVNTQMFVKLDPEFKELQAKENVVNVSLQAFFEQ